MVVNIQVEEISVKVSFGCITRGMTPNYQKNPLEKTLENIPEERQESGGCIYTHVQED